MSEEKSSKATFEHLYLKERKKAQIFMTASIVLVILLAGSIVIGANKKSEVATSAPTSNNFPFGGTGGGSGGPRGGQMFGEIKDFFNADGSVNKTKVDELLSRLPEGFASRILERMQPQIDEAVSKGEITSQQASELNAALGQ